MGLRWLLLAFLVCASTAAPSMFGEITTPNYPQGYPNDAKESWEVQVPKGYDIRLYFIHLDIEPSDDCDYDSLKVLIGNTVQEKLCGRRLTGPAGHPVLERHYSTTKLTLLFTSDFSNQERYTGFAAYYMAVDVDECEDSKNQCSHFCNNYIGGYFCSCPPEYDLHKDQHTCGVNCSGGLYTDLRGQISSPGYPSPYPENSRCDYKVLLEYGYQVILTFQPTEFDIEEANDGSCSYDSLTIKAKGKTFGPYCGKNPPARIETESNVVDIVFQTDSGGDNKGWKIRYSEDAVPCPNRVTDHSLMIPLQEKYLFKDMVTIQCEEGYEIVAEGKKMLSFQTRCQGDGTWTNRHLECHPVDCGDPEKIEFGDVEFISSSYKSEARYRCKADYYTLNGEETYSCSLDGRWLNSKRQEELPECKPVCGRTTLQSTSRIYGGDNAKDGFFPWMGYFPSVNRGSGSLISDRWVVTAAHVVQDVPPPRMRSGNVALRSASDLQVKRVILHPDWVVEDNYVRKNYDNDIALVQLNQRVEMGPCISPICLPGKGEAFTPEVDLTGHVAGWGKTSDKDERTRTPILQYVPVVVRQTAKCKASVETNQVFTDNMFCAGGLGKDSCQGDSGGPLMFVDASDENKSKTLYIGGIVSWGVECGKFGMYTKVQNYVDWIWETIQKVEEEEAGQETKIVNICTGKT